MYKAVKFWLKIVHDSTKKLCNASYDMLKGFDEAGDVNWVTGITKLLYGHGFGDVWLNQGVGHIDTFLAIFKQRVTDTSIQN